MSLLDELKRRNVLRVAAAYGVSCWVVVELASVMFERFGFPIWTLQTLLALMLACLFPLLWFAWNYELTAAGFQRDSPESRAASIAGHAGRRLDQVTVVMLLLALGVIAGKRFLGEETAAVGAQPATARSQPRAEPPPAPPWQPSAEDSVAVIPFANLSANPDNEYFTDGISEEILNLIARAPGLRVASRTSSFSFKGGNATVPEIGRQLDVAHVLEGSVRRQGNRVRISAQLVRAENGFHLWSETYDREITDIFALQEDIANQIVNALELAITGQPLEVRTPTEDLLAYELFLRGRTLWQQRAIEAAIETLEQAVKRDAGFGPAWSALAGAYTVAPGYVETFAGPGARISQTRALVAARRAVLINPVDANALSVLANLAELPIEAERLFHTAMDAAPSDSTARLWYGHHRANMGHLNEALKAFETAARLDPLVGINHAYLGAMHLLLGNREPGEAHLTRAEELGWPNLPWLRVGLARSLPGREVARQDLAQLMALPAYRELAGLEEAILAARDDPNLTAAAITAIDERRAALPDRSFWYQYWLAGAADRVADELEQNRLAGVDPPMTFWLFGEDSPAIREQPAFHTWLERRGALAFYAEHGWPDGCVDDSDHLDCGGETP